MSDDELFERFLNEVASRGQPSFDREIISDTTIDRLPVVIAVDRSDSTRQTGDIEEISSGLHDLIDKIARGSTSEWSRIRDAVDLAIVSYGGDVKVELEWTQGVQLSPTALSALTGSGITPMGSALEKAASLMLQRLAYYRHHDVRACRGYLFNWTDGCPSDMSPSHDDAEKRRVWDRVKAALDRFETIGRTGNAYASTYHFASRSADRKLLEALAFSPDRVRDLKDADFDGFFEFIRVSLVAELEG